MEFCCKEHPARVETIYHPVYPEKNSTIKGLKQEALFSRVFEKGKILLEEKSPLQIHAYLESRATLLPMEHKRFISPHIYKVGISNKLMKTRNALKQKLISTD